MVINVNAALKSTNPTYNFPSIFEKYLLINDCKQIIHIYVIFSEPGLSFRELTVTTDVQVYASGTRFTKPDELLFYYSVTSTYLSSATIQNAVSAISPKMFYQLFDKIKCSHVFLLWYLLS